MRIKLSTSTELPEWFTQTDYSVTAKFSPFEWLIHLRRRRMPHMLQKIVSGDGPALTDKIRKEIRKSCSKVLNQIRNDPIARFSDESNLEEVAPPLFLAGRVPGPPLKQAVRQPTMQELSDFISYLPRSVSDGINHDALAHADEDDEYGERTPYWIDPDVWWHTPACHLVSSEYGAFHESKLPFANHLVIDMEQSDQTLHESFDAVVKSLRKDPAFSRDEMDKKGKLQFDRWARYSILPYLDLEQWCSEKGYTFPNRVFAAALSKFRSVGEENIRKTIRPAARSAITRSTLMRLESFVASNIDII